MYVYVFVLCESLVIITIKHTQVPNAKDLLKIQFKKVSEDITNSRLETNTVWSAESCISLRAHVMQSSLENEGIERNVRSRVEILEQELKRPARVDDMIAKSKKDIGMLLKRLELVKEQEKKRQKVCVILCVCTLQLNTHTHTHE